MSKRTAATLDPYIDNPEQEHDSIIAEGLEQALMSGLQQQAASGQIPPLVVSKIMELVRNDKMELAEALNKVTEDALKEQQAKQEQEMGGPAMSPDQAAAGATVQAMAGQQPAMSPIPGANAGQESLSGLLSTLRRPTQTVQPMRGADRGAI